MTKRVLTEEQRQRQREYARAYYHNKLKPSGAAAAKSAKRMSSQKRWNAYIDYLVKKDTYT